MIIVIDGPAGSGKSSTAKAIANRINIRYLDSGALYRALTYLWINAGKPDKHSLFEFLPDINLEVKSDNLAFTVIVNGVDVSEKIRQHSVSKRVSEIAAMPRAREFVNNFMRNLVKENAYIADGRDLGTAVFPDADLKFFMDASIEERAQRRFKELKEKGSTVTLKEVIQNLKDRDYQDSNREADPLRKAEDAIVIDTTGKTFDEQVSEMTDIIKEELKL